MSFELGHLNDDEIKLLAKETGLSIHAIQEAQKAFVQTQTISLDAPININREGYPETSLYGMLASEDLNPERQTMIIERNSELLKVIEETLRPRDYKVIMMRFGFETGQPMTLEEIGNIYGVTRERIRQIEAGALIKLRRRLKRDGKDDWFVD